MRKTWILFAAIIVLAAGLSLSWSTEPIPQVPPPLPVWKQVSTPYFHELDDNVSVLTVTLQDTAVDLNRFAELDIVKFKPEKFKIEAHLNRAKTNALSVSKVAKLKKALLAVNGGFFSSNFTPEGFLISNGNLLNSKDGKGTGVFYVTKDGKADIEWSKDFVPDNRIDFAVQAGPIVIEKPSKNGIVHIRKIQYPRTAVGITKDGEVFFVHVHHDNGDNSLIKGISLYEFAMILLDKDLLAGLEAYCVLNLDGGSSTGLYLEHSKMKLHYPELVKVSNVILVKKR